MIWPKMFSFSNLVWVLKLSTPVIIDFVFPNILFINGRFSLKGLLKTVEYPKSFEISEVELEGIWLDRLDLIHNPSPILVKKLILNSPTSFWSPIEIGLPFYQYQNHLLKIWAIL